MCPPNIDYNDSPVCKCVYINIYTHTRSENLPTYLEYLCIYSFLNELTMLKNWRTALTRPNQRAGLIGQLVVRSCLHRCDGDEDVTFWYKYINRCMFRYLRTKFDTWREPGKSLSRMILHFMKHTPSSKITSIVRVIALGAFSYLSWRSCCCTHEAQ